MLQSTTGSAHPRCQQHPQALSCSCACSMAAGSLHVLESAASPLTSIMCELHGFQPVLIQGANFVDQVLCHASASAFTHQLLISDQSWDQIGILGLHREWSLKVKGKSLASPLLLARSGSVMLKAASLAAAYESVQSTTNMAEAQLARVAMNVHDNMQRESYRGNLRHTGQCCTEVAM